MLMFLGHTAGQQMCVGENYGSFWHHLRVILYLIGNFSLGTPYALYSMGLIRHGISIRHEQNT